MLVEFGGGFGNDLLWRNGSSSEGRMRKKVQDFREGRRRIALGFSHSLAALSG